MDPLIRGLKVDPCADRNMVAVSNPSVLDPSLVQGDKAADKIVVHAYGAGNEPYEWWKGLDRWISDHFIISTSFILDAIGRYGDEYKAKKADSAQYLYRSVARALDLDVEEVRRRTDVSLIGTPLTHERLTQTYSYIPCNLLIAFFCDKDS